MDFSNITAAVRDHQARLQRRRSTLLAVSGIDGSGKGYTSARLTAALEHSGLRCANINLDPWHTPGNIRFDPQDYPRTFYEKAYRWDDLFSKLILPLRDQRSIHLTADLIKLDSSPYQKTYSFQNIDVVLLEGIFLFKRELMKHYDLTVWIECSFETAWKRALARNQEGLPPEELRADYERIYVPAQKLHFEIDQPQAAAMFTIVNDQSAGN